MKKQSVLTMIRERYPEPCAVALLTSQSAYTTEEIVEQIKKLEKRGAIDTAENGYTYRVQSDEIVKCTISLKCGLPEIRVFEVLPHGPRSRIKHGDSYLAYWYEAYCFDKNGLTAEKGARERLWKTR